MEGRLREVVSEDGSGYLVERSARTAEHRASSVSPRVRGGWGGCTARRAGRVSLYPARTAGHRLQGQNIMINTFDNAWENQATRRPMAPRFSLTSSLLHCESLIRCFVGRASEMKCTHVMQCKFVSDILNAVQCSPPARIYTIDKA